MTQPPSFDPSWMAPPPPATPGDRPIRGTSVALGVGLAMVGHLLTVGAAVGVAASGMSALGPWLVISLAAQALLFLLCLVFGILNLARWNRGLGLGLLVGWAVGVIVFPVIGFGVCVVLVNNGSAI